jgi:adenylate cyclase class 2
MPVATKALYFFAMANQEVEIKFLVEDIASLERKLRDAGFRLQTPRTHEMNTLYDFPDQRLRQRGELLRLRKYGERWIVTHKAKSKVGPHKSRIETETQVADGTQMAAIFAALGFAPTFRYEKYRSEWTDGIGHVVIDETPIGNVSEIEGPAEWIDATAKRLDVARDQYITSNYAQMFFEWRQRTGSSAPEMTFEAVMNRR